jgi:hypothetical protein
MDIPYSIAYVTVTEREGEEREKQVSITNEHQYQLFDLYCFYLAESSFYTCNKTLPLMIFMDYEANN